MHRLLTFWFRFTFPDKLTVPWPGFLNDTMKAYYMPGIVDAVFGQSPLMRLIEGAD